jgi:hypothetical protein
MELGYQDHSIEQRGRAQQEEMRNSAARGELVAEAKRERRARRHVNLERLFARYRKESSAKDGSNGLPE